MTSPTALVAHPYPLVAEALGAIVAGAGYRVARATSPAAVTAALAAAPDLVLIATALGGVAQKRNGGTRTIVIGDEAAEGVLALTAPVADLAAAVVAIADEADGGRPAAGALTPRERDVARLVTAGQRNRAIAATLGISEGTVKMHLHNVYAKLGLESRTQLAMATRG